MVPMVDALVPMMYCDKLYATFAPQIEYVINVYDH